MLQSAQIKDKEQSCPTSSCGHQPLQQFVKPSSVNTTYSQSKSQRAGETDGSSIDHRLHIPFTSLIQSLEPKCVGSVTLYGQNVSHGPWKARMNMWKSVGTSQERTAIQLFLYQEWLKSISFLFLSTVKSRLKTVLIRCIIKVNTKCPLLRCYAPRSTHTSPHFSAS